MNIQDLGSIGELISAVAVLVTLVYLAIQVGKTKDMLEVQYFDSIQANALNVANLELKLSPILLKANLGEALDPIETDKLKRFFRARMQNSLYLFFKADNVGRTSELPVRNFVIWLYENSSAMSYWTDNRDEIELQYQMMESSRFATFRVVVDAHLKKYESLRKSA